MNSEIVHITNLMLEVPGRRLIEGFNLDVDSGETVSIMGASGSGKTTLLKSLAGIIVPTGGRISIVGTEISSLSTRRRAAFRLQNIGMIFQFGELFPELRVLANVSLPLQLNGMKRTEAEQAARESLARIQLGELSDRSIEGLSGGEIQRVAIARALVTSPSLILADEPTGALDEANSRLVADLLVKRAKESGAALIVATHDPLVAERMDRTVSLSQYQPVAAVTLKGNE